MARESAWNGRVDTTLRILAATVGTLPPTVLGCACLGRWAPFAEGTAVTFASMAVVPVWVMAATAVFLCRTAGRAWGACLLLTLAGWLALR
ncbi:MAG: hypothetical protein V4850_31225 [Myxococcota bacterium]